MLIKLSKTFAHEGVEYESITVADYLQVGHRRQFGKHKNLDQEDAGYVICSAVCGVPIEVIDLLSTDDFDSVYAAVKRLLDAEIKKKKKSARKSET